MKYPVLNSILDHLFVPPQSRPTERLEKLFQRRKCWRLAELAQALDYAGITVRRLLKQIGYFRSYTDNGKWYTFRDSPQFNREGIWHHKRIGFSKHGSLTATINYWVGRSPRRAFGSRAGPKAAAPLPCRFNQLASGRNAGSPQGSRRVSLPSDGGTYQPTTARAGGGGTTIAEFIDVVERADCGLGFGRIY